MATPTPEVAVLVYCPRCDQRLPRSSFKERAYRPNGLAAYCTPCYQAYYKARQNNLNAFLTQLWSSSKNSANHRSGTKAEHSLTKEDIVTLWNNQQGLCYYSGLPLSHVVHTPWTASLERLDRSVGYHLGNCALVVLELNGPQQWSLEKARQLLAEVDKMHDNEAVMKALNDANVAANQYHGQPVCVAIEREIVVRDGIEHHWCNLCKQHKPRLGFAANIRAPCKVCVAAQQARWRATARGCIKQRLLGARNHSADIRKAIASGKRVGDAEFTLTFEQALAKLVEQRGRCAYSGVLLRFGDNVQWVASLERLDSQKGYQDTNVCWVAWEFNGAERSAGLRGAEEGATTEGWDKNKVNVLIESLRIKFRDSDLVPEMGALALTAS